MENREEVLEALDEFSTEKKISPILEQYLSRIASTGVTVFPWNKLKPLLMHKLDLVIQDFQLRCPMSSQSASPNVEQVTFDEMRKRLFSSINQFNGIPFTIQRLCELVTNPTKHYQKTDKYMRGVEKNLVVVTTVDPDGNRIVNESKVEINGVKTSGSRDLICPPDVLAGTFLPPVPPSSSSGSSTTNSWFSSLSSVVDSPSSYPNWSGQDSAVRESQVEDIPPAVGADSSEPPRKKPRLESGDDANGTFGDASSNSSPVTEMDGEEQKAIAPLLTQLLSTSGVVEQTDVSGEEQQDGNEVGDANVNDQSHESEKPLETSAGSDTFSEAIIDGNGSESVVRTEDSSDSKNLFSNFLSDGNTARHLSAENQFSNFGGKDDMESADDSTAHQESRYDYDVQPIENCGEQKSTSSDTAHLLPSSEWSSESNDGNDVDSVSNDASECGVDSLLNTSDTNISFASTESCAFGDSACKTVDEKAQQCELTEQENKNCETVSSDTDLPRAENELEEVGSGLWSSTTTSQMDTD